MLKLLLLRVLGELRNLVVIFQIELIHDRLFLRIFRKRIGG